MAPKKAKVDDQLITYLKERFDKIIDRVDPIETIAILGMTVLIKNGIDWTEASIAKIIVGKPPEELLAHLPPGYELPDPFRAMFPSFEFTTDLNEWLISFCIAFYIQRHGAQISGSITAFAKTLLI